MKTARVLARLGLLSLAAAAVIGLTQEYAGSLRPRFVNPYRQEMRLSRRPDAPQLSRFPSFFGEGVLLALIAVAGRLVFRLRLSDASRSDGRAILLDLGGAGSARGQQRED